MRRLDGAAVAVVHEPTAIAVDLEPHRGAVAPLAGERAGHPAFAALDDFTLATPTLEDVYLALGGRARDLERA